MKNLRRLLRAISSLPVLLAATGCSHPVLDYRNAEVSDGLIYAGGANEPFTGSVTHVPDNFMINGEGHTKFMRELGGDRYAVVRLMQVVLGRGAPASLCTISVRKGYVDGAATCYRPQTDTRAIEAHFDQGQLSGKLVYYNPEKTEQKIVEGSFKDGQPDGQQKIYGASSGGLVTKVTWSHGLYDGDYASYNESNGKAVLKGNFAGGRRNGTWEQFTADGKTLIVQASYKDGNLDGVEEHFDPDTGKRILKIDRWTDGKIGGTKKIWDRNGVPVSDETYADGVLVDRKDVSANQQSNLDPLQQQLMTALAGSGVATSAPQKLAEVASPTGQPHGPPADLDACVSDWVAAHRKAVGDDAVIAADQLDEWQAWCVQGKRAPK